MSSGWGLSTLGQIFSGFHPLSLAGSDTDSLSSEMLALAYHRSQYTTEDHWRPEKVAVCKNTRGPVDPNAFLRVREAVCVAGYDREAVKDIKNKVGRLQEEPFPIEGFHVKAPGDVKDGALLVPKLILVARHCPGRKLLDDEGDEGQLDLLYDEAVEMEADVMLIYVGLPQTIYKPIRRVVYHPKLAEMVFPSQPLLRALAADNCLVTLTEGADLSNMQKNVIREWLNKPVNTDHPVYKVADYMSSVELTRSGRFNFNQPVTPKMTYYKPSTSSADHDFYDMEPDTNVNFQYATEEHPLADKKKKKRKKEKKEKKRDKKTRTNPKPDLGTLVELVDDIDPGTEMNNIGKTHLAFSNGGQTFDQFV